MIKITVLYPTTAGATFDHEYFEAAHIDLIVDRLGVALIGYDVERGLSSGDGTQPPPYVAIANLWFESAASYESSFGPHADELVADIANYTDIEPIIQMADVVNTTSRQS